MKEINPKKVQVDKNQTIIFASVAIASILTISGLVISHGLWNQSRYYSKVIDKKEIALKTLNSNKEEVRKLTEVYNAFDSKSPNLMGGNISGPSDKDGSNSNLVLNALPSNYDFPALISSVDKLLFGYANEGISGTDDILAQSGAMDGAVKEIPLTFSVKTDYARLKDLMSVLNLSIRPFAITNMELSGSDGAVTADFSLKTYYQPNTSLKITEEVVR